MNYEIWRDPSHSRSDVCRKNHNLLERAEFEEKIGEKVVLVKPRVDTRYEKDSIVSHKGRKASCYIVENLNELRTLVRISEYNKISAVIIGEAQFFDGLKEYSKRTTEIEGKKVIIGGLDGNTERESFWEILDLLSEVDTMIKLRSRCEICNRPALFTNRKSEGEKGEFIGGSELYNVLCRENYIEIMR